MNKSDLDKYYEFYQEIPQTDYLIDIEIQDEYDKPNDSNVRGLSAEQVSQIAVDSLNEASLTTASQDKQQQISSSTKKVN